MKLNSVLLMVICALARLQLVRLVDMRLRHRLCPDDSPELKDGESLKLINENADSVKTLCIHTNYKLEIIPVGIFETLPKLEELYIYMNEVNSWHSDRFNNSAKLRTLHLWGNKIRALPTRLFTDFSNVEYLDLGRNKIDTIEVAAFDGMTKLTQLYLSTNLIRTVGRFIFAGAPNIKILRLDENRIETIEEGALNLPNLQQLTLEYNMLTVLSDSLLSAAPNLERVNFDTNKITHIGKAFNDCHKLLKLNLMSNPIEDVNFTALASLENLLILQLRYTSLQFPQKMPLSIPPSSKLKILTLRSNNLSDPDLFKHLSIFGQLEALYVSENRFTVFNDVDKIKEYLPQLHRLDLKLNEPSLCDWVLDNEKWLKNITVQATLSTPSSYLYEKCPNDHNVVIDYI